MDEKKRKSVGVYVMQFAEEKNLTNKHNEIGTMNCRHNVDGETVFEMKDEDVDMFMDVVNPEYVN